VSAALSDKFPYIQKTILGNVDVNTAQIDATQASIAEMKTDLSLVTHFCSYTSPAISLTSITGGYDTLKLGTKISDANDDYNNSAVGTDAWKWTCPQSGTYLLEMIITMGACTTYAIGNFMTGFFKQEGTIKPNVATHYVWNTTSVAQYVGFKGMSIVECDEDDELELMVYIGVTSPPPLYPAANHTLFKIMRISD